MGSRLKPWSKAKIRRVNDSIHSGGYVAERSRQGWVVRMHDSGSARLADNYLIPFTALQAHEVPWLTRRLRRAWRQSVNGLEGVRRISGPEAWQLVRWCTRWKRPRRKESAAVRKAREDAYARKMRNLEDGGWYLAERSRRGWVVRQGAHWSRVRGIYLIPFRALRPHMRRWHGGPFVGAWRQSLRSLKGARRISQAEALRLLRGNWTPVPGETWQRVA